MTFTLAQLRCARLVAEAGSFSEAARRSGLSQSTVSANVSELEAILGVRLFRRTTRKVEPSAFGRTLLPLIADVLAGADALPREARALLDPDRKLLRVALSPLVDSRRLTTLLRPYRDDRPDVEVVFKECDVAGLENRLDQEQVDIVFGVNVAEDASRERCVIYSDVLRYLRRGGADADAVGHDIDIRKLADQVFVLTIGSCGLAPATRALFKRAGVELREYLGQAANYFALQEWAELGIGAAILPETRIGGPVGRFPVISIDGQPARLTYEAVWNRGAATIPHIRDCVRHLKRAGKGPFRPHRAVEQPTHGRRRNPFRQGSLVDGNSDQRR